MKRKRIHAALMRLIGLNSADKLLIFAVGALLLIGLVMLISASSVVAYKDYKDSLYFFKRQLVAIGVGLVAFIVAVNFNREYLKKLSWPLLILNIILLILVLVLGLKFDFAKNGSRAWIPIFGFNLQPSELLKPIFLLYLASLFSGIGHESRGADKKFIPFLIVFSVLALLIVLQPDVGTLFIITMAGLVALIAAGTSWRYLSGLVGVGALVLILLVSFSSHQQDRFHCLIDSNFSPKDKCYQLNQSLIAVGSGGVMGRGLGESRQKYLYLPEVQNDFIFAVIIEETGFIAGLVIIGLYSLIFYRSYLISKNNPDQFTKILAISIGGWIFIQAALNIGGVIRLFPMTGVPLPLISYGGSAMIANLFGLGMLINLSRKQ